MCVANHMVPSISRRKLQLNLMMVQEEKSIFIYLAQYDIINLPQGTLKSAQQMILSLDPQTKIIRIYHL